MNRVDFSFFSDGDEDSIPVFKKPVTVAEQVIAYKERAIITVLEELENRVPSQTEVQKYGEIRRYEGDNKEVLYWRGKPALLMKWFMKTNQTGNKPELVFQASKLYSPV